MGNRKHSPDLLDYSLWATVDTALLSEEEKIRYLKLEPAVKAACDRIKTGVIKQKFGVSASHLTYLIDQCTSIDPSDGRPRGFRALVRPSENSTYVRSAPLVPGADGRGLAGAFEALLRGCPKARRWLHARLKPDKDGTRYQAAGLPLFQIHQDFLDELKKDGRSESEYPFNVERQGYEALCSYVKQLIEAGDLEAAIARFGPHAADGLDRNPRKRGFFAPVTSFERVAYDEWKFPAIGTLTVIIDEEEIDIPLERSYFCPLVDFRQFAVLGWTVSVPGRFNRFELLRAFECAVAPPQRKRSKLFDDLPMLDGQGLPGRVIPNARGCRISILAVDNHLSHLANDVVLGLRKRTGVVISYGRVRKWIGRYVVEGLFSALQRRIRTLASTTGSGPDDPAVADPVGKAVRYRITQKALVELIAELVDQHNAARRSALYSAKPNEVIARDCDPHKRFSILPRWSEEFLSDPKIAIEREFHTIRGNQAKGIHPYIEIDGAEYTNNILKQSWDLIGQVFEIQIRGDFRTVLAYRMDGTEFGSLHASGSWAQSAHTRDTRKAINKAVKDDQFLRRSRDPVRHYRNKLASDAAAAVNGKKRPSIPKAGQKLAATLRVDAAPDAPPTTTYTFETPKPAERARARPRNRRQRFSKGATE